MVRALDDVDLEAVLGASSGVRGPTIEEEGELLAGYLVERAARRPRSRRVQVSPALLRHVASRLTALADLAREGV